MTFSNGYYNKLTVGYFELKLHKYILGTPETNITSCKKGHNRCPLMIYCIWVWYCTDSINQIWNYINPELFDLECPPHSLASGIGCLCYVYLVW